MVIDSRYLIQVILTLGFRQHGKNFSALQP